MYKILTVIGARPQFIKAATVSRVIEQRAGIVEILVHTGQHYDENMSDIFFSELHIPKPNYNLGIGGGTHGVMTGRQIESIEKILIDEKPDVVLVYGDTNSTLAGTIAAVKLHIPVSHVEAGLRSFNRLMPEEINRVLTDHASELLFAPTKNAVAILQKEGIPTSKIHLVGDVMLDAAIFYRESAQKPNWYNNYQFPSDSYILATIHRAENTDCKERLEGILSGLSKSEFDIILPLHPRTKLKIAEYGIVLAENIHFVEPVGYLEMIWLEMNATMIVTDSGGVQKEAYFQGKKCITLRDETEWVELVHSGWNTLVGFDSKLIADAISKETKPNHDPYYGMGNTAEMIVDTILNTV